MKLKTVIIITFVVLVCFCGVAYGAKHGNNQAIAITENCNTQLDVVGTLVGEKIDICKTFIKTNFPGLAGAIETISKQLSYFRSSAN